MKQSSIIFTRSFGWRESRSGWYIVGVKRHIDPLLVLFILVRGGLAYFVGALEVT